MLLAIDWQQSAAQAAWVADVIAVWAFIGAAVAVAVTLDTNRAQQQTLELQRRQLELQQRQLADERELVKRDQASKISFYIDSTKEPGQYSIIVCNSSDAPVYWPVLARTSLLEEADERSLAMRAKILPTGRDGQIFLDEMFLNVSLTDVRLFFTDTAGRIWSKSWLGELVEQDKGASEEYLRNVSSLVQAQGEP